MVLNTSYNTLLSQRQGAEVWQYTLKAFIYLYTKFFYTSDTYVDILYLFTKKSYKILLSIYILLIFSPQINLITVFIAPAYGENRINRMLMYYLLYTLAEIRQREIYMAASKLQWKGLVQIKQSYKKATYLLIVLEFIFCIRELYWVSTYNIHIFNIVVDNNLVL